MPNFKTNKEANPEGYEQGGSEFYGYGNQKRANGMPYASPCKTMGGMMSLLGGKKEEAPEEKKEIKLDLSKYKSK